MEYLVTAFRSLVDFERWNLNKAVPTAVNFSEEITGRCTSPQKRHVTALDQNFLRRWDGWGGTQRELG